MPVGLRIPRGTMKPPMGAMVNPHHPFSYRLSFVLPLNEVGCIAANNAGDFFQTALLNVAAPQSNRIDWGQGAAVNAPTWASNREGRCLSMSHSQAFGKFPTSSGFYMLDHITVAFVRRKLDTTLRTGAFYTNDSFGTGFANELFYPFNDGNIYGRFGSTQLIVAAGGALTNTNIQRGIFTAGPQGASVWLDGVKLGGDATVRTRTSGGVAVILGNNAAGGVADFQEINWFQVSDTQWSDEICRWWSAEPYAHLYAPQVQRRYFLIGDTAGSDEFTIDGTPRDILGYPNPQNWSISEQLNERGTMRFAVKSMDASYRPGLREVVDFRAASLHLFAGHIHHMDEGGLGGYGGVPIVTQCGATDFNALLDRRLVGPFTLAAGTLKSQLLEGAEPLEIYGVTVDPAQVDGPTMPELVFQVSTAKSFFDRLSVASEYAVNISYDLVLSMFAPGTEAAPFDVVDNDARVVGDVRVSPTTVEYGNKIYVNYTEPAVAAYAFFDLTVNATDLETATIGSIVYTFKAAAGASPDVQIGGTIAITIDNFVAAISHPEVGAVEQASDTVRITASVAGAAGNGIQVSTTCVNGSWFTEGHILVSHLVLGTDAALTGQVTAEDVPAQDGGLNLYEKTYDEPTAESAATAQALADGYLVRSLVQPREIRYRTRLHGVHPGQQQSIQVTGRNIGTGSPVGTPCLITAVDIWSEGELFTYDVTAVEGLVIVTSHQEQWRLMSE
jgi:hypothetical protein